MIIRYLLIRLSTYLGETNHAGYINIPKVIKVKMYVQVVKSVIACYRIIKGDAARRIRKKRIRMSNRLLRVNGL